jgi:hypothetical protein
MIFIILFPEAGNGNLDCNKEKCHNYKPFPDSFSTGNLIENIRKTAFLILYNCSEPEIVFFDFGPKLAEIEETEI